MKKTILLFAVLFTLISGYSQDAKQQRRERIQTSYMLSLGRPPSESEVSYWQGRADANTISDFVKNHKTYIGQDVTTRKAVITKAYNDAMGRNPIQGEMDYWSKYDQTYSELMKAHVQWLGGNGGEYENVIKRSYQFVLGRQPSAGEVTYWKGQGTLSYLVLVGCHEDWKKKSGTTAQKTSGGSSIGAQSSFVSMIVISSMIAGEARTFAGIVAAGGGNIVAAGGGNIVAAGGGNIVAAGGGNIVAAGGGN